MRSRRHIKWATTAKTQSINNANLLNNNNNNNNMTTISILPMCISLLLAGFMSLTTKVGTVDGQVLTIGGQLAELALEPAARQPSSSVGLNRLEAPPAMRHQMFVEGPGVDLVALNQRRFEMEHNHQSSTSEFELKRGELIESKLAAIPDHLLSALPEDVNRQLLESLSTDPTLIMGPGGMADPQAANFKLEAAMTSEDPDGASIERLSKSCLTVHASSAKPEQLNVTFHLYTRQNPHLPYIMRPQISRQEIIQSSPFKVQRPVRWITHGFHTNLDKSEWMLETKDKILAFEDANVFLTDWRRGASPALAFYPKAAANAHVVAKMIVKILRRIRQDIDFARVHLIGHSLGAHIMGFVGSAFTEEHLQQQQQQLLLSKSNENSPVAASFWRELASRQLSSGQLIGRITACDPALPCFGPTSSAPNGHSSGHTPPLTPPSATPTGYGPNSRATVGDPFEGTDWTPTMWTHLRPDSAMVVEVMHSNPGVMGYSEPLGDYDFYPNGYERQPGCGVNQAETTMSYQRARPARVKRQLTSFMSNLFGRGSSNMARQQSSSNQSQLAGLTHTLDRFMKPFRDFLHGYTCSHHRSVEYMVESMFYEQVPQERRLDSNHVCQMVGYRCPDYASFKRGFCFRCQSELDCRAFTMSSPQVPNPDLGSASTNGQFELDKFKSAPRSMNANSSISTGNFRRALPTFNHRDQNYLPPRKNQYFFDTKPTKNFCLNHYHLYVKYRWFRVRESVQVDGFMITGTLANISQLVQPITFHRHSFQTYTLLLTERVFLGQVETLLLYGDKLKPMLVDYIELTYLSNLDPRIRALGSARLCRAPSAGSQQPTNQLLLDQDSSHSKSLSTTLFVRCSRQMV